jgi:uncharacterized damage-inducible protein DinB
MTREDIRLLYEYDRWANRRVLKAASTLSHQQFTRAMSGSFHCVRDTLLHILGGEWIWLAYWRSQLDGPASLSELRARRDALFSPEAFANVDALQSKWIEVELEQSEFVNRVTNKSLAKMLPFRGTRLTFHPTLFAFGVVRHVRVAQRRQFTGGVFAGVSMRVRTVGDDLGVFVGQQRRREFLDPFRRNVQGSSLRMLPVV